MMQTWKQNVTFSGAVEFSIDDIVTLYMCETNIYDRTI